MAETSYSYSIADDTLNGLVNEGRLFQEIIDSSITIAPSNVLAAGDSLSVIMKSALSGGEETTLDSTVAAHTGEAFIDEIVTIKEDQTGVSGRFQTRGEMLTVPANSSRAIEITWPWPIKILSSSFYPANDGDMADGVVGENTCIGALVQDVARHDTQVMVTDSVIQYIEKGFRFRLDDGVNHDDFIVVDVNSVTNILTLNRGSAHNYAGAVTNSSSSTEAGNTSSSTSVTESESSVSSSSSSREYSSRSSSSESSTSHDTPHMTMCYMTVAMSYAPVLLDSKCLCECGRSAIGGSLVPANVPLKITYWNNSGSVAIIYMKFEYWY